MSSGKMDGDVMMHSKYFHPRAVPNEALASLRKLTVKTIMPQSPEFGQWLHSWVDCEQAWRKTDPGNRPKKHLVGLPPANTWDDRQLGLALRASTVLSYLALDGSLSDFVDRIVLAIAEVAAERLVSHGAQ
jgi:hypothetical protein